MWEVQDVRHIELSMLVCGPFVGSSTHTSLLLLVAATSKVKVNHSCAPHNVKVQIYFATECKLFFPPLSALEWKKRGGKLRPHATPMPFGHLGHIIGVLIGWVILCFFFNEILIKISQVIIIIEQYFDQVSGQVR